MSLGHSAVIIVPDSSYSRRSYGLFYRIVVVLAVLKV